MSAVAGELAPSTAEEAFACARSTAAPTPAPRIRLIAAPARALVPQAARPAQAVPPTVAARISVLRASDVSVVTDDDDRPSAVPSADPGAVGCSIALAALEVLAGRRPVAQLARWLAPGVYEALQVRAGLTVRVARTPEGARRPVVRRYRVTPVAATTRELSVITDDADRVRAVAVRLEAHRGAWRATALEIG